MKNSELNRRDFIGRSVTAGVAASLAGKTVFAKKNKKEWLKRPATVIKITHSKALNNEGVANKEIVQAMVDKAVLEFTNAKNSAEAWSHFISPQDVVGLKINTLGLRRISKSNYTSHFQAVTEAVSNGIVKSGVKEKNIIIWDRNDRDLKSAGYSPDKSGTGIRCYGTADNAGFEDVALPVGSKETHLSKILTQQTNAMINIPLAKTHRIAGITGAMKNHYGSIDNPNQFHSNGCCEPGIAELNTLDPIRQNTRLIVMDALYAVIEGGPRWNLEYMKPLNSILVATDPVAIDRIMLELIDGFRKKENMTPEAERVRFLDFANELMLGESDLSKIDLVEINLG